MSKTADRVRRLFRILAGGESSRHASTNECLANDEVVADSSRASLCVGVSSHRGPRQRNEDYASFSWKENFFAVSDGIGGAPYGDVMSRLACSAAVRAFDEGEDVYAAFRLANEVTSVVSDLLGERSGATLLLAEWQGAILRIASVGDTRAFVLRDGQLRAITDLGRASVNSNALSKAVGYGAIDPDVVEERLVAGDRVLLCTDGVWEYLEDVRIAELLGADESAPLVAEAIAWEASRVGRDNSTCVCIYVEDVEQSVPYEEGLGPNTPDTTFEP